MVRFDQQMTSMGRLNAERTRRMARQHVSASSEAIEAILHLRGEMGGFVLRHVGGEECEPELRRAYPAVPRGPDDISLGTVGGVLFMIDRQTDIALGYPDFRVDVAGGQQGRPRLVSRALRR